MAHKQQQNYCESVAAKFQDNFNASNVLDIGSLDINGNNRYLFSNCNYTGVDIGEGNNVDVVSLAHKLDLPNDSFDVVICTECLEHDMFYKKSLPNMLRMLKTGGVLLFTCATTGRPEHGTLQTDGGYSSPLMMGLVGWENYYKNLTEEDIIEVLDMELFSDFEFITNDDPFDLYFYGIKK